ncbi:MAG: hypothetical protein ACI3XG_05945 [Faecousia sp.]
MSTTASEYLLKKAREEAKPEQVRILTRKEKRRNWWHYHKWHVVIAAALAVCIGNILWNALGIGKVEPDYSIAYVGSTPLSEETAAALRSGFAALSPDLNGDGKVTVELQQYISANTGDSDSLYYAQAAQVQLVADITECKSYFFLLEDPAGFQKATSALRNLDGSLPFDGDLTPDGKYVLWADCPMLAQIELGAAQEAVSQLSFARRGFWTEKTVPNAAGCDALWERLTEGAKKP